MLYILLRSKCTLGCNYPSTSKSLALEPEPYALKPKPDAGSQGHSLHVRRALYCFLASPYGSFHRYADPNPEMPDYMDLQRISLILGNPHMRVMQALCKAIHLIAPHLKIHGLSMPLLPY